MTTAEFVALIVLIFSFFGFMIFLGKKSERYFSTFNFEPVRKWWKRYIWLLLFFLIPLPANATTFDVSAVEVISDVTIDDTVYYSYKGKEAPVLLDEVSRTSNAIFFTNNRARFFTAPTFVPENGKWIEIEYATTTKANFEASKQPVIESPLSWLVPDTALADVFFAGAGDCGMRSANSSWATCRAGDGELSAPYDYFYNSLTGGEYRLGYFLYPVDTSGLSGATVNSAILYIRCDGTVSTINSDDELHLVDSNQSDTSLCQENTNWDLRGDTSYGHANMTEICNDGDKYYPVAFGDTSLINSTGYTTIGLRAKRDIDNSAPVNTNLIGVVFWSSYTGTDHDPYLDVTFTETETEVVGNASGSPDISLFIGLYSEQLIWIAGCIGLLAIFVFLYYSVRGINRALKNIFFS